MRVIGASSLNMFGGMNMFGHEFVRACRRFDRQIHCHPRSFSQGGAVKACKRPLLPQPPAVGQREENGPWIFPDAEAGGLD